MRGATMLGATLILLAEMGRLGQSKYAEHAEPMGWAAMNIAGPSSYSQQAPSRKLPTAPRSMDPPPLPLPSFPPLCPIPEKHDRDPQRCTDIGWVLKLRQWDCLAAHKSKPSRHKGAPYHMFLMFKSLARQDACQAHLWGTREANELTSVETMVWEQPIQNFMGLVDVYYINRVYAHARSEIELKELLDVGPPPLTMASSLARKMDIVDISMMMLSYIDKLDVGGIASHFQEPIRQTGSGTMVADFRRIARWKQQDNGLRIHQPAKIILFTVVVIIISLIPLAFVAILITFIAITLLIITFRRLSLFCLYLPPSL
ncbi:hypothetical protein BS47DRAFT_1399227 [Hydnum rufescens UP504]|uniref:Uncharacterized protein n=1 Tax=Hydnum rufescens UP504 TaxID=1448309 RepID=A0A9P6AJM1_9AGAM|nr:hypothetical protein BS47DRAFT_1399227 [Hydnum rufescens UP504]